MHTDVLIVGGGPAGLSAAIAARAKGLRVTLVDFRKPPVDKPCGEGLLPDAVKALRELGVDPEAGQSFRFTGIRFQDSHSSVAAEFPGTSALGVRRTVLHQLLVERAESVGVNLIWGAHARNQNSLYAEINGQRTFFRWLVAADGMNSSIRHRVGLDPLLPKRGRFAFRRHFALVPWSPFVEVHWGEGCQIVVTPTGREEICLALFTSDHRKRLAQALPQFPELARRIDAAQPTSPECGARTVLSRMHFAVRGNVALAGDAGCSIDGVAGQGLNLAFQQAHYLAEALAHEDLATYAETHRKITRTPVNITRLMLLMAQNSWIREKALRMFAAKPTFFFRLISIHASNSESDALRLHDLFGLGWRVLRA
jgi:2-polyprenyl-6-methoxyphenol hydroxylase-like FAD-dependent oxidoreductase